MSRKVIREIYEDYELKRSKSAEALHEKLITEEGYRRELDGWNRQQKWSERLATTKEKARARFDAAASKVDRLRADYFKAPTGNAQEQLLFEMRAQRTWARAKTALDNLDHTGALGYASRLIREAEGHDAVALAQELGAYFDAKGYMTSALDSEFDAKIPGLAEAQAEVEQANAEYREIESAAGAVRDYMAGKVGRHFVDICAPAATEGE